MYKFNVDLLIEKGDKAEFLEDFAYYGTGKDIREFCKAYPEVVTEYNFDLGYHLFHGPLRTGNLSAFKAIVEIFGYTQGDFKGAISTIIRHKHGKWEEEAYGADVKEKRKKLLNYLESNTFEKNTKEIMKNFDVTYLNT